MAHFAQLNSDNVVVNVIVISNDDIKDNTGIEVESIGVALCQRLFGGSTSWKQCSYNNRMRGNYAGAGYTYMTGVRTLGVASTDVFLPQQPYPSWTVGINTAQWYPPDNPGNHPALSDSELSAGKYYVWNESNYASNPSTAWVLTSP